MSDSAKIFNPKDDSLNERVRAYRSTHQAWQNVEASLKYANDPEWSDTLGESEELDFAHDLILDSMKLALQSFTAVDIDQALTLGLINPSEASEMTNEKRYAERQQELEQEQESSFKL